MSQSVQVANGAITLTVVDGQPTTTSNEVAQHFGKRHDNVLQSIAAITAELPAEFTALNFQVSEFTDSTGRALPCYRLTRDGFTLLAMGFTGSKALAFKLAYIDAFNRMEKTLTQPQHAGAAGGITRVLITHNAQDGSSHVEHLGSGAAVLHQPADVLTYLGQLPKAALDAANLQKLAILVNAQCFGAIEEERKDHTRTVDQIKAQLRGLNTTELLELAQESHSLTLRQAARPRLPRQLPLVPAPRA